MRLRSRSGKNGRQPKRNGRGRLVITLLVARSVYLSSPFCVFSYYFVGDWWATVVCSQSQMGGAETKHRRGQTGEIRFPTEMSFIKRLIHSFVNRNQLFRLAITKSNYNHFRTKILKLDVAFSLPETMLEWTETWRSRCLRNDPTLIYQVHGLSKTVDSTSGRRRTDARAANRAHTDRKYSIDQNGNRDNPRPVCPKSLPSHTGQVRWHGTSNFQWLYWFVLQLHKVRFTIPGHKLKKRRARENESISAVIRRQTLIYFYLCARITPKKKKMTTTILSLLPSILPMGWISFSCSLRECVMMMSTCSP